MRATTKHRMNDTSKFLLRDRMKLYENFATIASSEHSEAVELTREFLSPAFSSPNIVPRLPFFHCNSVALTTNDNERIDTQIGSQSHRHQRQRKECGEHNAFTSRPSAPIEARRIAGFIMSPRITSYSSKAGHTLTCRRNLYSMTPLEPRENEILPPHIHSFAYFDDALRNDTTYNNSNNHNQLSLLEHNDLVEQALLERSRDLYDVFEAKLIREAKHMNAMIGEKAEPARQAFAHIIDTHKMRFGDIIYSLQLNSSLHADVKSLENDVLRIQINNDELQKQHDLSLENLEEEYQKLKTHLLSLPMANEPQDLDLFSQPVYSLHSDENSISSQPNSFPSTSQRSTLSVHPSKQFESSLTPSSSSLVSLPYNTTATAAAAVAPSSSSSSSSSFDWPTSSTILNVSTMEPQGEIISTDTQSAHDDDDSRNLQPKDDSSSTANVEDFTPSNNNMPETHEIESSDVVLLHKNNIDIDTESASDTNTFAATDIDFSSPHTLLQPENVDQYSHASTASNEEQNHSIDESKATIKSSKKIPEQTTNTEIDPIERDIREAIRKLESQELSMEKKKASLQKKIQSDRDEAARIDGKIVKQKAINTQYKKHIAIAQQRWKQASEDLQREKSVCADSLKLLTSEFNTRHNVFKSVLSEILDSVLTCQRVNDHLNVGLCCGVCFEVYRDPHIVAPCGHSFCKECIDSISTEDDDNTWSIICPECPSMKPTTGIIFNKLLSHIVDEYEWFGECMTTSSQQLHELCVNNMKPIEVTFKDDDIEDEVIVAESEDIQGDNVQEASDEHTLHSC